MEGKAECHWESGGKVKQSHEGVQSYFQYCTDFIELDGAAAMKVQPGRHVFNFEVLLPDAIPYSVEGKHGYIRYQVDADLAAPLTQNLHAEEPFTVIRYENLSRPEFSHLRQPAVGSDEKSFSTWGCRSMPLVAKVSLNKMGFGLGERVPIQIEIMNKCSKNIKNTKVTLVKVENYRSQTPVEGQRTAKEDIVEKLLQGVKSGESVSFLVFLEIPKSLLITNRHLCDVFQIDYEIKFEICGIKLYEIIIPIGIGTFGITEALPESEI